VLCCSTTFEGQAKLELYLLAGILPDEKAIVNREMTDSRFVLNHDNPFLVEAIFVEDLLAPQMSP
jgi:hypothetical protein